MSSDESNSTQVSKVSNKDGNKTQLKSHKSEQWEINLIGNLVLDLYHRSLITAGKEWLVEKKEFRKEYSNYINAEQSKRLKELNGTADIGTLLHRCGFLLNTGRGSPFYKIKYSTLFEFRNNKLKELDNSKINNDGIQQRTAIAKDSESILLNLVNNKSSILIEDNLKIDENKKKNPLEYQGSKNELRKDDFFPTNMSCCICQEDFNTIYSYEEHIQKHGDDTDFEYLTTMNQSDDPIFKMSYRLCTNSHYFCFEFETNLENLIIEKIIIVQSRSFYYVHNMRVPYKCPKDGKDRFFVDSHLFTIHLEQPIVIICHLESSKDFRIVEQHHFMRSEEFPKVNFAISPNLLPHNKKFKPILTLPDYFPTKEIQDSLKDDLYHEKLMKTSNEFIDYVRNGKQLQPHNIKASINILLQIEDMDTIRQYVNLAQKNIKIRSCGDEYSFQLNSKQRVFIENILSAFDEVVLTTRADIFTNDNDVMKLMLQNSSDIIRSKNTFVGQILAVNTRRISFKCHQKINIHATYTVICRPSRLTFRYQYRALEKLNCNMHFLKTFLFPTKIIPRPLSTISLSLYNNNIKSEQLQAVRNIAEGPSNDATYIIFGPPGTGKTTTLVEAILQLLKKPDTKVLVTASSNSACDEIAILLCKYLKKLDIARAMVRIYSRSCEVSTDTIDDELLENSNMYNGQFYPDIEILHEYRIVVCTLYVVAKLSTGKFGKGQYGSTQYTHLFIDEVAASTEAEALQAITAVLTAKSCLIISGDHKQLGPVLQSKRAKELGLDASLMDRLLERDCYRVDVDSGNYDRTIQTRLVRNYRSHPAIVNLYSRLFYNHALESFAKKDDVSLCEIWHKSRNKQYPIMFHAIYEPSCSNNQSHSLYNPHELYVVMDYVKDLMYFGINGKPVNESDIGIISPYKKQYKRIQEELNIRQWFKIETGSVETFQGKEKNIIIVSFVRSGTRDLGFLDCPRRLNVTISRPKSLLIMVGNPQTLSLNSDFEYIIKECQRNNTFVGSNGPKRGDVKKQATDNEAKSEDKLTLLNKNMKALKVDIKDEKKNTDTSQKTHPRRRCRNRNRGNSKNRNCVKQDADNIKYNDVVDDDDEEDADSVDSGNDIPYTSTSAKVKSDKAKNKRKLNNRAAAKGGKISKQYGKGKKNNVSDNSNKNLNKSKIETIFNELPKVPTAQTQTGGDYTKVQQQHYYQNPYNTYSNMNDIFFKIQSAAQMPPASQLYPPFIRPQQPSNSSSFNQPLNYTSPYQNAIGLRPFPHGNNVPNHNAFAMANNNKTNENITKSTNKTKTNVSTSNTKNARKRGHKTNAATTSSKLATNKHANRTAKNVSNLNSNTNLNKLNENKKTDGNKTKTGDKTFTDNLTSLPKSVDTCNPVPNICGIYRTSTQSQQRSTAAVNQSSSVKAHNTITTKSNEEESHNAASIQQAIKRTTTTTSTMFGNRESPSYNNLSTINSRPISGTTTTYNTTSNIRNQEKSHNAASIQPAIKRTTTTTSTMFGNGESPSYNNLSTINSGTITTYNTTSNIRNQEKPINAASIQPSYNNVSTINSRRPISGTTNSSYTIPYNAYEYRPPPTSIISFRDTTEKKKNNCLIS